MSAVILRLISAWRTFPLSMSLCIRVDGQVSGCRCMQVLGSEREMWAVKRFDKEGGEVSRVLVLQKLSSADSTINKNQMYGHVD